MRYVFGGKNYYIAISPLFTYGGDIAIFPEENLLYSHFPAYPGKGENGSITPALIVDLITAN